MSAQVPSAVFPIAPPVAQISMVDPRTGHFTPMGINLFTQLWAGLQGKGGVKDDTTVLFNMSGDATISNDGVLTISVGAITTEKLADGAVTTVKVADKAIVYAKIQDVVNDRLLGRADTGDGPAQEILAGVGLVLASGALNAVTPAQTVASLGTGVDGQRAIVSDATATTFASIVAGSGANTVPVYWDAGAAVWRIG